MLKISRDYVIFKRVSINSKRCVCAVYLVKRKHFWLVLDKLDTCWNSCSKVSDNYLYPLFIIYMEICHYSPYYKGTTNYRPKLMYRSFLSFAENLHHIDITTVCHQL